MHCVVEERFHLLGDAELDHARDRDNDVGDIDLGGEIGRQPPVRPDARPRRRRHRAADVGALIERLANEVLHLLADAAGDGADDVADRTADGVGRGADRAARLERAGERRCHHQRVRLPGNIERPAGNGPVDVGVGHQRRDRTGPLAGKIARGLCIEGFADRRHGDGGGREHRRYAGQRFERRHRHQRRPSSLERSR